MDQKRHICECHAGEGAHPGLAGFAATASKCAWAATATPSHSPIVHRSVPGRVVIF